MNYRNFIERVAFKDEEIEFLEKAGLIYACNDENCCSAYHLKPGKTKKEVNKLLKLVRAEPKS